jgi:hypothetical protein
MIDRGKAGDTLAATVAEIADRLGGVTTAQMKGGLELRRGSILFAAADLSSAEFRLRPDIAEAVLRTPDTAESRRGGGWVRFEPKVIDPSVEDRLEAWITSAWRAAQD